MRIRLFKKEGATFEYRSTIHVGNGDLNDAGDKFVRTHEVEVGDIVYMNDTYLQLAQVEPKIQWTSLHPQRPEVQGLYGKAVWVERLSGGVLQ